MLMKLFTLTFFLFALTIAGNVQAAHDAFSCQCQALGPGVENKVGEKLCSYKCNCTGYNKNETPKKNILVNIDQVTTSARSFDSWDSGSSICHGQYAYKPNLSDPNWKIKVKFSSFSLNSFSTDVFYAEADQSVEIAVNVRYYLKREKKAPEIFEALRNQL